MVDPMAGSTADYLVGRSAVCSVAYLVASMVDSMVLTTAVYLAASMVAYLA